MSRVKDSAPDYAGHSGAQEVSPLPFDLVEGNEHHGPYIVNGYGADVCDFYAMSNPSCFSVRNGGTSKPVWFTDAAGNAAYMVRATNAYADMLEALHLMDAYLYATAPESNERQIVQRAIAKAEGRP